MKQIIFSTALCLLCACADAKTVTIGIDLSGSNPFLAHENFVPGANRHVSRTLSGLKTGDTVRIKTIGSRNDPRNFIDQEFTISRRVKPRKVADLIAQYLHSLPKQKDIAQGSTNLIAWLEFTNSFACENGSEIFVITDGLEASSYVDPNAFLQGNAGLPKPDVELTGCKITFYGLGAGWPPQSVKHVRAQWRIWFEAAGAQFHAIIP